MTIKAIIDAPAPVLPPEQAALPVADATTSDPCRADGKRFFVGYIPRTVKAAGDGTLKTDHAIHITGGMTIGDGDFAGNFIMLMDSTRPRGDRMVALLPCDKGGTPLIRAKELRDFLNEADLALPPH